MNRSGSHKSIDNKESDRVSGSGNPLGKNPRTSEMDIPIPVIPDLTNNEKSRKFKTKLCSMFRYLRYCTKGKECTYAHGRAELRRRPHFHRKEVCRLFLHNKCHNGSRCRRLHSNPAMGFNREDPAIRIQTGGFSEDQRISGHESSKPVIEKTLCKEREQTRRCTQGERYPFGHGQAELEKPGRQSSATSGSKPTNTTKTLPSRKIGSWSSTAQKQQDKEARVALIRSKSLKELKEKYADWIE